MSALAEAIAAGTRQREVFAGLRFPKYSPPLRVWYVVGGFYYGICFLVLWRVLRLPVDSSLRAAALGLVLAFIGMNAVWNVAFFRLRNLKLSYYFSVLYSLVALVAFVVLLLTDRVAAVVFIPYVLYLVYANYWGFNLWKLNEHAVRPS